MIEILALSPLTNKELCSLAFECKAAHAYPVITWNVTFPTTPKPEPSPPQPPSVSSRSLRISPHDMKYVSVHSRLAHPLSTYSISLTSMSTSPTSPDHKQTALSLSAVVLANPVRISSPLSVLFTCIAFHSQHPVMQVQASGRIFSTSLIYSY